MAEDAVDAACRRLGTDRECRTRTLPLVGAAPREVLARLEEPTRLVRRYGTEAGRVAELGRRYPRFAGPVAEGVAYTGAEMLFGVLAEGALTVEDLVERRTRTSFVESAVPAAREVAAQVLELATT
nr:glycerol-3-phosphate dehydrogenase C-terminal domain-containing protein [uncultured Micrococcus sp.]